LDPIEVYESLPQVCDFKAQGWLKILLMEVRVTVELG
jgi:hypothetical protein